ncbi:ankyrin repeat domain-containing protein [Ottowia thiooxydans]|uniref:Ankyrin repeat domain-containing protein n=1 Tax=Ottowia thiooxydans TaxID=219182 RepID=A0ABV2QCI6_9BURK
MNFPKSSQQHDLPRTMSSGAAASNQSSAAPAPNHAPPVRQVTTGPSAFDDSLQLSRAQSEQDVVCADGLAANLAEAELTVVFPEEVPPEMSEHDIRGKLLLAARHGDASTAKALAMRLGSPSELNSRDELGDTPLLLAVRNQHTETVKVFTQLLGSLKELTIFDAVGSTPLMIAAKNCDVQTAKLLVGSGAAIDAKGTLGFNAIMKAAEQTADLPYEEVIEFLINQVLESEQFRAQA